MAVKVLVVDDEQPVRERFTAHIPWAAHGFECIGAASGGREALTLLERGRPQLLLVDITMPGMNGLELTEIVRRRWPEVRVIFLTAHSEFDYARQALLLGARNYLLKVALSAEQIIAACRQATDDLSDPADERGESATSARAEFPGLDEAAPAARQTLATRWLEGADGPRTAAWLRMRELAGFAGARHCGALWIGFDRYGEAAAAWEREHAAKPGEAGLGVGSGASLAASAGALPEAAGGRIGGTPGGASVWPDDSSELSPLALGLRAAAPAGLRAEPFPYGGSRLLLLVREEDETGAAAFQTRLNALAQRLLSDRGPGGARRFVWIGGLPADPVLAGEQAAAGLRELGGYFYDGRSYRAAKAAGAAAGGGYAELGAVTQTELLGQATKAFYGGGLAALKEVAGRLTQRSSPPCEPASLLALTRDMARRFPGLPEDEALPGLFRLLSLIERWDDYTDWWERALRWLGDERRYPQMHAVRWEIQEVCRYIDAHYAEELRLSALAEVAGLNPRYLGQLFRQVTGEYCSDYVNRVRMQKAQQLLHSTGMKVYEVAAVVGVPDYRYFCKLFKKLMGISPSEYKRK